MDIVKRMDKIIEIKKELLKELKELRKEADIWSCEDTELHIYCGIEKIEKAYGVKADFDVRESSYGIFGYKSIMINNLVLFQMGNLKSGRNKNANNLTEDDFDFVKK